MRNASLKIACLVFVPAMIGIEARAQDAKIGQEGISAGAVRSVLQGQGKESRIGTDGSGDPRVYVKADGYDYDIFFYDCGAGSKEDRTCASYQFFVGYIVPDAFSQNKINVWNRDHRYAKAHLFKLHSGDNHARIEIDVLQAGTGANPDALFSLMFKKIMSYSKDFRVALGCGTNCKQTDMNQVNSK